MAWRLGKSVIRGEVDNRERGCVTGRIWLVGCEEPITLTLEGDCLRDIAGARLRFHNPAPEPGDHVNLAAHQSGAAGDMTASRKVRVLEVSMEEAGQLRERGARVPEHLDNTLYLEWYSDTNGRVVLEGSTFIVEIAEPSWRMTPEEELAQLEASHEAAGAWMERLAEAQGAETTGGSPFLPDPGDTADEFEWERCLKQSDILNDRFTTLLDKYADNPDRDRLMAREMGWTWLETAIDAQERGEFELPAGDEDEDIAASDEPDPAGEGRTWTRNEHGEIMHPLSLRAQRLTHQIWEDLSNRDVLKGDDDPEAHELCFQSQCLCSRLSSALDELPYDPDIEGGYVVAMLKRAFRSIHSMLQHIDKLHGKHLLDARTRSIFRAELFAIRDEVVRLMQQYRRAW